VIDLLEYRQHLPATRDLIADRDRWTTGALALRPDGTPCGPKSPPACAWCVLGAFMRVSGLLVNDAEDVLRGLLGRPPSVVNDREGHPAVLALLDRAIRAGS
jgi:hypothetical protein